MSVLGVNLQIFSGSTAQASLTAITALWWDTPTPSSFKNPTGKTAVATTDGSGYVNLDISNVSGLTSGDYGFLMLYQLNVTDATKSLVFSGKVVTSTISSGVVLSAGANTWTRNSAWLTMTTPVSTDQVFYGLHAVYPESNFVALSASGNYTLDWGDGTGSANVAAGVRSDYNIPYANAPATSDVGIASAVSCTFTDTGDTVNLTAHGHLNGDIVAFSSITSTTGISTYTSYYVISTAANTFQVSTSIGGTALALTTDGSGSVYVPKYRQVIVTVGMQSAQTFTALNLHLKNATTGLQQYSSGWLDIAIAGSSLTDIRLGVVATSAATQVIYQECLEQFNLVSSNLKNAGYLCYNSANLRNVVGLATSATAPASSTVTLTTVTNLVTLAAHGFANGDPIVFTTIAGSPGVVVNTVYWVISVTTDTFQLSTTFGGSATAFSFNTSPVLKTGTNFGSMFNVCYALQTIPLINTAAGTNFGSMFNACYALQTIPLLNTAAGTSFNSMFQNCYALQTIPLFNTAAGTSFNAMFQNCYALQTIPLFNTAAGTSFNAMFLNCYALQTIPLFNTAAGTSFFNTFLNCYALQTIPLFNTAAGTNFSSMFSACSSLSKGTLAGTAKTISYANCKLSSTAINEIFTNLASGVTAQTITLTGNWGTAGKTSSIATAKGWTVTG